MNKSFKVKNCIECPFFNQDNVGMYCYNGDPEVLNGDPRPYKIPANLDIWNLRMDTCPLNEGSITIELEAVVN